MSLQSRWWLGLQTAEGLPRGRGSASSFTYVVVGQSPWFLSVWPPPEGHSTGQLASPRAGDPRESNQEGAVPFMTQTLKWHAVSPIFFLFIRSVS